MSANVISKLLAEVGDINIGISTDSMGTGDPNYGRRIAQKYAALYPKINVIYRRYLSTSAEAETGQVSLATQNIQTGTIAQTLTVINGTMPGNTLAYQTTNYNSIFKVPLDVMLICTGHTNGTASPAALVTTVTNYITFVRTKTLGADIWISSQNAETDPVPQVDRDRHYSRQLALRDFAETNEYPYVSILEAFDERTPDWGTLIQADGIHPTNGVGGGYDLWATVLDSFIAGLVPETLPPLVPSPYWRNYTPTTWAAGVSGGTPITAVRLNNIEQGILDTQTLIGGNAIYVVGPGVDPTGVLSSTAAVQPMLLEAQRTGRELVFPPGTYKVPGLYTLKVVPQPRITGAGANHTLLVGGGASAPTITMVGLSGAQSYGRIRNIRISNPGGVCLEIQGAIGVIVQDSEFHNADVGILYHNKATGDYTEFCWTENVTFRQGCKLCIEYRVTNGDSSFHGTGFRKTVFNQTSSSWGNYAVVVGAKATVYNAPWDGMFFIGNPGRPPIRNNSINPVRAHGDLTFEARPGVVQTMVSNSSVSPVYLAGHLNRLSSNEGQIKRGIRLYLVEDVTYYGTSGANATFHKKPYEYQQTLTSGANYIYEINVNGGSTATLVAVNLVGSAYNHHALLYITLNSSATGGTVQVLSTGYVFDGNSVGAPSFSMSDMNLVITRSGLPTGTVAHLKITPQFSGYGKSLI